MRKSRGGPGGAGPKSSAVLTGSGSGKKIAMEARSEWSPRASGIGKVSSGFGASHGLSHFRAQWPQPDEHPCSGARDSGADEWSTQQAWEFSERPAAFARKEQKQVGVTKSKTRSPANTLFTKIKVRLVVMSVKDPTWLTIGLGKRIALTQPSSHLTHRSFSSERPA